MAVVAIVAVGAEQRRWHSLREAELDAARFAAAAVGSALILPDSPAIQVDLSADLGRIAKAVPTVRRISLHRTSPQPGHWTVIADWDGGKLAPVGGDVDVSADERWTAGLRSSNAEFRGERIVAHAPVVGESGRPVGVVTVEMANGGFGAERSRVMIYTLSIVVLSFVGFALVFLPGRREEKAPYAVSTRTQVPQLATVDLTGELGPVGMRLQGMAQGVQEREYIRETFGRYVSARVAEALADSGAMGIEGEERQVTVLAGVFDPPDASVSPADVLVALNDLATIAGEVIDAHGGYLQSADGNRFVAVFGAPARLAEHGERAVRCGLAVRQRISEVVREWEKSGRAGRWTLRLGADTGKVIAGNIGGLSRIHYGSVGKVVDDARLIADHNLVLGTTLLFSDSVSRLLPETVPPGGDHGTLRVGDSELGLFSA